MHATAYTLFPCNKNRDLAVSILNRLEELGYKAVKSRQSSLDSIASGCGITVRPKNRKYGTHCTACIEATIAVINGATKHESHEFVLGDLNKLMLTDEYKIKSPIKVVLNSQYNAMVTDNEIVVGCQKFSAEKVAELAQAIEKYRSA